MTSTPADSQRLPAADAVDHEAAGGADALASQQGLPAVRLGPAAWHEVGGLWYLMLPLVVLLMGWALQGLQAREVDSLRDARLRITLLDIRDTLEADLALDVTLRDQAPPFDPLSVPEPDTTLDIDAREIGGLGVHFVRRMADVVDYHHDGQSNVLHLCKNFPPTGGTA